MAKRNNRYKQMERYMTYALLTDVVLFVLFLFSSGIGIIWLKTIASILSIAIAVLCLVFLYLTRELFRPRSLWMTATAVAIITCTAFSLMLGHPSPNPLK